MSTKLIIDKENTLKEVRERAFPVQPAPVRFGAKIISYLFHPVFIPLYVVYFMVFIHPYLFAGFSPFDKFRAMAMAGLMYTFFPLVTVLLLRGLKFLPDIRLHTQKDRVIPLIGCGIWYFWIWNVWNNLPGYPVEAVRFTLAGWISVSLALMANIVLKISLHAIAAGLSLVFILLLGTLTPDGAGLYISIAALCTGLVCTARFIDSDHSPAEVYYGLALGGGTMLVCWWLVG